MNETHDPTTRERTVRARLRAATDETHERLDAGMSALDLTTREGYAAFVGVSAAGVLGVERALLAGGIERLLPDWSARSRAEAITADLEGLGLPRPEPVTLGFEDDAAMMGAAYVLEGSRHGARVLRGRVRAGGDAASEANTRYLDHGRGHPFWPSFLDRLEEVVDDATLSGAIDGAERTFGAFEAALDAHMAERDAERLGGSAARSAA